MNSYRNIVLLACFVLLASVASAQQYPEYFQKRPDIKLLATDGSAFGCGGYWEYLPEFYNDPANAEKKYPLIIFLGGNSEGGDGSSADLEKMTFGYASIPLYTGLGSYCASDQFPKSVLGPDGNTYSFIVMILQCFPGTGVLPKHIEPYIDYFTNNYRVDTRRVFLTGYSIGGTRVWSTAGTNKTTTVKFAGVVPIDGGADGDYVSCPHPEGLECVGNASMYNQVISNLDDDDAPRVLAVHGVTDFNRPFGESFINGINRPANATIAFFPGGHGSWDKAYDKNVQVVSGQNIYQWMLGAAASLLPVTLENFDAIGRNNRVELSWNTSSESNSSHFVIERSSNRRDFKEIGRVRSSGNSTTPKNYSFTDNAPLTGRNHYRLKMVDLDNTYKYSEVRSVNLNNSDMEFSFGPNPVQNEATISISGTQRARLTITVTDLMGRTMKSMNFTKSENLFTQKINLADLPKGQYVLSIKGEDVNITQRLMKL